MAVSKLNASVLYDTTESVAINDKGYNAPMYNHIIYGNNVIIALGKENLLTDKGLKYYYVYLIIKSYKRNKNKEDKNADDDREVGYFPDRKIGVYEISIDDNEDPELNNIIVFPLSEKYIKMMQIKDVAVVDTKIKWFNNFILDDSFLSYDKNKDLFELICNTLNNPNISETTIRGMLSSNVNEEIFEYYLEKYNQLKEQIDVQTAEVSKIKKMMLNKKKKFDRQRPKGDGTIEQSEYNKLDYDLKTEKNMLDKLEDNYLHYTFMENLTTKAMLQTFILNTPFPSNAWSITLVERFGEFKLILLDENVFNIGDTTDVLQCFVENINDIGTPFAPSQYMIICKMQDGFYRLIQFDDMTKTFKFKDLPEMLKTKVADKCWDNNSGGLFHEIDEFSKFTTKYKETHKTSDNPFEPTPNDSDDVDESIRNKLNPDYSNRTVFRFHKVANSKPLPGMGIGESIGPETVNDYSKLSGVENWRRKLSDMYISPTPFELDGHMWNSVEHYYQANKFKQSPEMFDKFVSHETNKSDIEGDSTKAQTDGNKITKKRKVGAKYRNDVVLIDDDYTIEKGLLNREMAQRAKFSQNYDLKQMLISTKQARLDEYKPYNTVARVSNSLAKIRREFAIGKKVPLI